MLIHTYLKAFIISSFMLVSIDAFSFKNTSSFENEKYLESIFELNSDFKLLSEEIQKLDAKKFIKIHFDKLTFNIYSSNITEIENSLRINPMADKFNLYMKMSDNISQGNILQIEAVLEAHKGNIFSAKKKFESALLQYKVIRDHKLVSIMAHNLSWTNFILGNYTDATEFNNLSIASGRITKDDDLLFDQLFWQNDLLLENGDANQAEELILKRILMMAYRTNNKQKEWQCYYYLGKSYLQQKKLTEAKWFFVQALTLSNGFDSKKPKIKSLLMLAKVKGKVKDYELAIQDLKVAESLSVGENKLFKIDVALQMAAIFKILNNKSKENYYSSAYIKMKENYVN